MSDLIFIQIASYRDKQLLYTIRDCINNSKYPENLRFCICWQHDENETLDEFLYDYRFKIISIYYKDSNGACWARNKIQQFYNDEKYTLQLDSHHRFVKNWDEILINMYNQLILKGHLKPAITTYIPSYNPENDPEERCMIPWKMKFDKIIENNIFIFLPEYMDSNDLNEPLRGYFYSGHFCFTSGKMCLEVPHDPNLYFIGEEANISIRLYTYGYDVFYPNCLIAWHEYTRKNRDKHWDDDSVWWKKDQLSKQRFSKFLKGETSDYGMGNVRSLSDYQIKANICLNISQGEDVTKKKICDKWQKWIDENNKIGISIDKIREILLNANFSIEDINNNISNII